ncbi:MAG: hypothetical protein M3422_04055 [Actinomycetota bacterium]|nr:hypothetical protein [Actinomycetota bacterium]
MTSGSGPLFMGPDVADAQTVAVVEVASQPSEQNEPGGRGADFGKSSPVGLLVLLLFFIAVAFLVRSMTKHLKRVPASFDTEPEASGASDKEPEDAAPETGETPAESSAEEKKS